MTEQQRARLEIMADPESPRHGLRPSDCEAVGAALNEIDRLTVILAARQKSGNETVDLSIGARY